MHTKMYEKNLFFFTYLLQKPMKESLLNLTEDLNKLACETFFEILRYSGDMLSTKPANSTAQDIVQLGIDKKPIRDEIYVQLMRQTNENPIPANLNKVWELFGFVAACFAPSPFFVPYVEHYLKFCTQEEGESGLFAVETLSKFTVTVQKEINRKYAPGAREMDAIRVN